MSTRATVVIKDGTDTYYLYQHRDGYIEELGEELINKLIKFDKLGMDWKALKLRDFIKKDDYGLKVDDAIHGDESFIYQIDCINMQLTAKEGKHVTPLYSKHKSDEHIKQRVIKEFAEIIDEYSLAIDNNSNSLAQYLYDCISIINNVKSK
ncbi:MAG: hypothetical protein LBT79_00800 [Elusimicrobiota bacterium]|jgi:hypothetical protein|nr:hypothetical protein [Elusimicrobiota bacterium]